MSHSRRESRALLGLVFIAGVSAMVFLIVYIKLSSLLFGNSVDAFFTVFSTFMAGLAVGSYGAGRLADRLSRPLLVYGVVITLVGLLWCGMPLYFQAITDAYIKAAAYDSPNFWGLTFSRIVRSGLGIFVPAVLMGASLPLVAKHFIELPTCVFGQFSKLYRISTLGALAGGLGAIFGLLPSFGVVPTLWIATGINLGIGLLTIGLQIFWNKAKFACPAQEDTALASEPSLASYVLPQYWLLLCACLSGFFVFSLNVIWIHLLHLTVGGSTYVRGAIFSSVLLGLVLGSWLAPWVIRRFPDARRLLLMTSSLTALLLAATMPIWNRLPDLFPLLGSQHMSFAAREGARFLVVVVVLLFPSLCIGILFPMLVGLGLRNVRRVGRTIGSMCAVYAIGSILGLWCAGFFLLPKVGSEWSLTLHAMVYALLPIPLWWSLRSHLSQRALAVSTVAIPFAVAILLMFSKWDPRTMASGANSYFTPGFRDYEKLLYFKESMKGGVTTVVEKATVKTLLSNGRVVGATGPESFFQTQMALVPMTLMPRIETALTIGLSTGRTLETMAIVPFRRIDVVEIVPEIVEVARRFFLPKIQSVLDDPRIHIANVDGRNFLLLHPEARYDLITIQGNSMGQVGNSTREFYEQCRSHLATGGILLEWLPLHAMRWHDQVAMIATMATAFSYVSVWAYGHQAMILGSEEPMLGDYQLATQREPALQSANALAGFATPNLLSVFAYYHLDNTSVRAFLRDAIPPGRQSDMIASDLHPILESAALRSVGDPDNAALFFRKTAPYSYVPLTSILVNVPPHEVPALLRLLEDERLHFNKRHLLPHQNLAASPAL